jgi:multidrug transporter EmrE-like cation transporter
MKQYFFFLIILAVAFEVVADILFKYWSINAKGVLLWSGVTLYAIGTVIWAFSLKYEFLSKAIVVFTVLNLVIVALVGVFLFKENLSSINKIGIILGIIGVILVQI